MTLERRTLLAVFSVPLLVLGTATLPAFAQSGAPLSLIPMTPCRIVDTRAAAGLLGDGSEPAPIAGTTSRSFPLPSSTVCSVPASALAFSLNVTAIPHATLSYLTTWPTGETQPLVSTLNSVDGRVKANAAVIPAGAGGAISVYATDTVDLVLDINGYFLPAGSTGALAFYALTPCRVVDTRNATGPLGGPGLVAQQDRSFPILSSNCNIPSGAQAYSLNITAVPWANLSWLSVWPTGQAWPGVSTLNADLTPVDPAVAPITANAAIVPAGTNGAIEVLATDDADLVIDINGYFASAGSGGLSLYNLTPCRVLDTRNVAGAFTGVLPVNVTASSCGAPSGAQAFVLNATVVPMAGLSYLTLWPLGESQPLASTLNASDAMITSNMAIVPTTNGSIDAYATNPTNLVVDINGYFAPTPPPAADNLAVIIPGNSMSNPSGEVSGNPGGISCGWAIYGGSGDHGISCSATFSTTTVVTLTAAPSDGFVFGGWSGGCSGTAPTCEVTVTGAVSVNANFTHPTITLTPTDINWLEISPGDNRQANAYPGQSALAIGQFFTDVNNSGCPDYISYSSLVSFNTLAIRGKTIDSATLALEAGGVNPLGGHESNFRIAVVASSWNPATVTWNYVFISPGLSLYNAWASGEYQVENYPTQNGQIYSIEFSNIAQNWANGSFLSDGLLVDATQVWSCPITLGESDTYTLYPTITITYH